VIHRPYGFLDPKKAKEMGQPFTTDVIKKFSHDGCSVEIHTDYSTNDLPVSGFVLDEHEVDKFDLGDINPESVHIEDACGQIKPWNCEDQQGKYVSFKTSNAKPKIHEESSTSSRKSTHGFDMNLEEKCKQGNKSYCDEPEHKEAPLDTTQLMVGFTTPEYAKRFEKAFRHAVELCGGKPSAF